MASFVAHHNPDMWRADAEHFGVSVDNLLASFPSTGLVTTEIIRAGNVIVLPAVKHSEQLVLSSEYLFRGVYGNTSRTESFREDTSLESELSVPENVVDYCKSRNIPLITVVRVGANMLTYVAYEGVRPGMPMKVCRGTTSHKRGSLDSILSYGVTPLNTIGIERNKATRIEKAVHKLG